QPAAAGPIPISRSDGAAPLVEQVQYRRRPVVVRKKRRGDGAAAAALAIGALAIGAAVMANQSQRRDRAYYYEDDPYYHPGYGYRTYQPQPYYAPQVQPRYRQRYVPQYQAPEYYAPQPRAHRWRPPAQPDAGSNYAIEQQRAQNRGYRGQPRVYVNPAPPVPPQPKPPEAW
ncbi:MAG TPA: hypothetical protein PLQ11_06620, partial [Beijerinckiaceae bacterium]|nr:hypothetical protein [Beijerinckiaceae bacterium]